MTRTATIYKPLLIRLIGASVCMAVALFVISCGGSSAKSVKRSASVHVRAAASIDVDGIHAVGNRLVAANGRVIHLHGVDTEGTEYQCVHGNGIFDTSPSNRNADAMAAWHVNFVRIDLNALCVDCALGVPHQTCGARYMTQIQNWVRRLNRRGMYVEIGLMWDIPCNPSNCVGVTASDTYQLAGGPTEDHAPAAWATMARDFRGSPNVMLGIWGEDYDNYPCKLHGGPTCNGIQADVETTNLTAPVSAGSQSSLQVSGLSDGLIKGETIWLSTKDSLTVSVPVGPSSGTVTIPVHGSTAAYPAGASLYYASLDPGDHTGVSATLTGPNPGISWNASTAGAQQAVRIMRANGFRGPIVYTCADAANVCSNPDVAGGKGGYDAGTWLGYMPSDPDHEIVAAADLYGPSSSYGHQVCSGIRCWRNTIAPILAAGHPFILNEVGPSSDGSQCSSRYTTGPGGLLPWLDAHGASGYAAWSWFDSANSCLDLVSNYTSGQPNPDGSYAAGVRRYYRRHFPANR